MFSRFSLNRVRNYRVQIRLGYPFVSATTSRLSLRFSTNLIFRVPSGGRLFFASVGLEEIRTVVPDCFQFISGS